jgi:hypothetical protein
VFPLLCLGVKTFTIIKLAPTIASADSTSCWEAQCLLSCKLTSSQLLHGANQIVFPCLSIGGISKMGPKLKLSDENGITTRAGKRASQIFPTCHSMLRLFSPAVGKGDPVRDGCSSFERGRCREKRPAKYRLGVLFSESPLQSCRNLICTLSLPRIVTAADGPSFGIRNPTNHNSYFLKAEMTNERSSKWIVPVSSVRSL